MVRKTLFGNGLTVVTEEIPQFVSCSLGIWVKTGSRFETPEQSGFSHFLEHMYFKGTPQRSAAQIAQEMDGIGGQNNAFTEKEHTCFYARVMDRHLPVALDILSDMYLNSKFDATEIEREKGVVLEEINMCEDSPEDVCFELFTKELWPDHPLGRPILGTPEIISGLTRAKLMEYRQALYGPERIMVAAAGSLRHQDIVEAVSHWFGGSQPLCTLETLGDSEEALFTPEQLQRCQVQAPDLTVGGVPRPRHSVMVKYRDSEQVNLCYGVQGISAADPRRFAVFVLDSVLGGSMSCRLFQEIREQRGLAYAVGTFQNCYRDCGSFGIYAGTSAEHVDEVLQLSRAILDDIRQNGLTEEEIIRAREHIKGSLALGLESTSARMMRLARSETYHGRFLPVKDFYQAIDNVDNKQIITAARELLAPENFSLAVLGPIKEADGVAAVGYME